MAQALSRGAFLEMLSACLALYFGQLSYNPRKVGWFGFIEGLYDVVPNAEMWELEKEMDKDGRVVFGLGWAMRSG